MERKWWTTCYWIARLPNFYGGLRLVGLDAAGYSHTLFLIFSRTWWWPTRNPRGKDMWRAAFLAMIWTIRKERNGRCFNGIIADADSMAEFLKYTLASWMQSIPHFRGYSLDQLMHNWRAVAGLGEWPVLEVHLLGVFFLICFGICCGWVYLVYESVLLVFWAVLVRLIFMLGFCLGLFCMAHVSMALLYWLFCF